LLAAATKDTSGETALPGATADVEAAVEEVKGEAEEESTLVMTGRAEVEVKMGIVPLFSSM